MSSGAGVVAALDDVLDRLAAADPAGLSDLALVRRIAAVQQRLNRLHGLLLRDIALAHGRGAAAADGFASTQALLRRRCRLDGRAAAQHVAVAATVGELPDTAAALTGGDIAVGHAAAICQARRDLGSQVLAGGAEQLLLAEARAQPAGHVWRLARVLRDRLDPDGDRDARMFRDRWLDVARTLHGMVSIQGMLDPATGELLMTALGTFTPPPDRPATSPTDGGPADAGAADAGATGAGATGAGVTGAGPLGSTGPAGAGLLGGGLGCDSRTAGQRRADGLADLCRAALGAADGPLTGEHRPHVTLTVDLDTLRRPDQPQDPNTADPPEHHARELTPAGRRHGEAVPSAPQSVETVPGGSVPGGAVLGPAAEPISAATARRLACDAGVIPAVLGSRGEPLDIGRLSRTVPAGMRRALHLRDRGCRFPGCDQPPHRTDAHHIRHWARHGPTSLANLVLLCAFHHWLVHEGQWTLHYDPAADILTTRRPDGTPYDLTSGPPGHSP